MPSFSCDRQKTNRVRDSRPTLGGESQSILNWGASSGESIFLSEFGEIFEGTASRKRRSPSLLTLVLGTVYTLAPPHALKHKIEPKKNVPNALSYTDPYQVRRGRGRPGPLFGAGQKVIAGVFVYNMWSPKWGKRKSARTHKIYKSEGYW